MKREILSIAKEVSYLLLLILVIVSAFIGFMGWSAEIRLQSSTSENNWLRKAFESDDVKSINDYLERSKAIDGKQIAMYYLEHLQDPSSIPVLVSQLSFELPWWDNLDRDDRASDIRLGAYETLQSYKTSLNEYLEAGFQDASEIGEVYIKALLFKQGNINLEEFMCYFSLSPHHYKHDFFSLTTDLGLELVE